MVTRRYIRSGIDDGMDPYVTNLIRNENYLLRDLIIATEKELKNLPPVKKVKNVKKIVTLYLHAPKSRLAVDCLIIFTKYCAESPTTTTEGKFHNFVQLVHEMATGEVANLETPVKQVIDDWKAGRIDLTAIDRLHYAMSDLSVLTGSLPTASPGK